MFWQIELRDCIFAPAKTGNVIVVSFFEIKKFIEILKLTARFDCDIYIAIERE